MKDKKTVVVLGASVNRERYSNKAIRALRENGHTVFPVNPGHEIIEELKCYADLAQTPKPVNTVTIYLAPNNLEACIDSLINLRPARVIFNPGSESRVAQDLLSKSGIYFLEACTLVMLNTGQF